MKNYMILLACLMLTFSSCAQTSFIKKASAFASERKTGTEMVDDNGNPVQQPSGTNYTVYVELSGQLPQWQIAWYNNQMFSVTQTKVNLDRLEIGIDKRTGKKIIIQPAKGLQLWQLELLPSDSYSKPPMRFKTGEVLLKGLRGKKLFYFRTSKMVFLQTPDAV